MSTATSKNVLERCDDIIKSENDDRLYRGLVLSNNMKVLLISDPKTDKSAAALDVNIGYMCDPNDLPGLAHFCEHMLFMGTKKYPEKNDYTKYLSENGGSSNALTHVDHTTYYFDVDPEKLKGALDRFSQFFITPLFDETLTELELKAIHSEHLKNLASDTWRFDQLDKSTADPQHPYSKFGTGNIQTLDVIPKQKSINVRERLLKFHEDYYSANIMALCILGKESLNELEEMTVNFFNEVKNKEIEVPTWPEHPFTDEHFRTKWYIVPVKNTRNLHVTFPIPDLQQYYRASPTYYISYLLGHEGKNSLLSALKAKSWSNSLVCGKRIGARGFCFFSIVVDLTEKALVHIDDIVSMIFQNIYMLRNISPVEWIYNEYRDVANMNFRFTEKRQPRVCVMSRVQALQEYPMEEVLCADRLFKEWKPDLINWILTFLTPQNIRIHIVAKAFENIANETEYWYGTRYKKEKISSEIIDMWENEKFPRDCQMPSKNKFIAEKLDIKQRNDNIEKFPKVIEDSEFIRLWFKQDDEFLVPKAKIIFDFISPIVYMDPMSCNLSFMFAQLFRDSFTEYVYPAELAGLQWELSNTKYGITLAIGGYDNKQRLLLEMIMDHMINLKVQPERFEILKENYVRSLKNFAAEQPYQHAVYHLAVLLAEQVWTKDELLSTIDYLTIDKTQQFISQLFSNVHVECLIHGNVTEQEARDTIRLIEYKLKTAMPAIIPLWQRQLLLYREIKLENGCHFLFEAENKFHKSSCAEVYYQTGMQSTEMNMNLELLAQIISEPCYNVLRTQEQLGYIVFSGVRRSNGTQGLKVIVQSDKHPQYVEKRIDVFMHSMFEYISTMSEEQFEKHKNALATLRLEKPKMLSSLSTIFWNEISTQQYNFDRANIEVAYLKTITQNQLINFFKDFIHSNLRCKLSVHVISRSDANELNEKNKSNDVTEKSNADANAPIDGKVRKIDDIVSFKLSQSLYPLLEPYMHKFARKGIQTSKL